MGNKSRGGSSWLVASVLALGLGPRSGSACTTIVVGRNASADGSTMSTHNADCLDCDFRLGRVPARDWPAGSQRPVVKFRAEFPRTVSEDRGYTWTPENLDPELPQRDTWIDSKWREDMVLGYIPQVNHTFAYLEGLYAIINEKQVAIGESTCGAKWFAGPLSDDCDECNSLFDISELSRVALERASTAREAIQIMGDLAVEYGFYGSEWDSSDPITYEEAGEALTVTDPDEAWVFHVLSDYTTKSAIWAAQRVPADHVSVVANQFIIKEVYPDPHPDFMFSDNLFEVAEKGGCGYKRGSGFPLHFVKAFGTRPDDFPHFAYSTRRVWRVLDTFAPSLGLSPFTDTFGQGHPFSASRPDNPITTQDVWGIVRDHYEGTEFDLRVGLASGPFGDVDRYDWGPSLDGSTNLENSKKGFFERSISIFRTSYSSVTQSRSFLPDEVGGLLWVSQYKPSMSTCIPIYVGAEEVPRPYTIGSLLRFSKEASYWAFSVVGNWAERFRMFAHEDVAVQRSKLEEPLFEGQADLEYAAAELVSQGNLKGARSMLAQHTNESAIAAVSSYHTLFETLVARYHDGYQMEDPTAETVKMNKMFYPQSWLEAVGFFDSLEIDENETKAAEGSSSSSSDGGNENVSNQKQEKTSSPYRPVKTSPPSSATAGSTQAADRTQSTAVPTTLVSWQDKIGLGVGALFFTVVGIVVGRWSATRAGYLALSDPA
ncbi:unnamed protein product [Ectocarpus sp. 13 AM-2016]